MTFKTWTNIKHFFNNRPK